MTIRFGSRPSYGSEGSRKPSGYDSSVSGGYGYANSGFGGYSFNRPTGYGGSTGGYGISGSFANGDEFGPVEPNRPEGHTPSHPNINAQKVMILRDGSKSNFEGVYLSGNNTDDNIVYSLTMILSNHFKLFEIVYNQC